MSGQPAGSAPEPQHARLSGGAPIADVLARVGHGDQAAFEELYHRTSAQVHGLMGLMAGDAAVAGELTVAVYQQLWRTAARYEPARGSATAWVLGAAHGHAARYLRARRCTAGQPAVIAAGELAPLAGISLPAALEQLDPASRELILLIYYRGYSAAQGAGLLGLPAAAAPSRLRWALSRLR